MWDTVLALLFSLLQNPIAVSAASQGSVQLPLQPHISEEGNLLEPEFQDTSNHDVHINFESAEHVRHICSTFTSCRILTSISRMRWVSSLSSAYGTAHATVLAR